MCQRPQRVLYPRLRGREVESWKRPTFFDIHKFLAEKLTEEQLDDFFEHADEHYGMCGVPQSVTIGKWDFANPKFDGNVVVTRLS